MGSHITQGQVLPYARAVISSGHTTSVLGALTHGLPSLLLPNGSGTEEIAGNCERAGAAICMAPETVNAESLRKAVKELLENSKLRQKALALKQAFNQVNGCEHAAELLEGLATTPALRMVANRR
jgi:UDP:flavonoid glycosyltransferase YjiC (YdhE family)